MNKRESIKALEFVAKQCSTMKVIIVILSLTLAAVADHHEGHHDPRIQHDGHDYRIKTREDLARYREDCAAKLNVGADMLERYKKWEYPNDETTRCYMKCIFEHFEFFDEKTGFNPYMIHHQLVGAEGEVDHNDELHRRIDVCADNNEGHKSDACTWAYRGGMCFLADNLQFVKDSVHRR